MESIFEQYKNGMMSKLEFIQKFSQFISPLFQISNMLSGLNMSLLINESGIIASLKIDTPTDKELTIKLSLDDTDMAQIPYDYLIAKRLPEMEEFEIFFNLLGEKGTFIDIGANVGWYSILAAYSGAEVYSFEPIPRTYQRLCSNVKLNALSTIKTFNIGIGEEAGEEIFYFNQRASGASSRANLEYLSDGLEQEVRCRIDTLDNICLKEKVEKIDLIKCDVEGGEIFVFRGGIETIQRFRPFVISEMLRKWSAKFGYHPNNIIQLFKGINYKCVALSRRCLGRGTFIEEMLETTEETNFLFVPVEKEEEIRTFMTIL